MPWIDCPNCHFPTLFYREDNVQSVDVELLCRCGHEFAYERGRGSTEPTFTDKTGTIVQGTVRTEHTGGTVRSSESEYFAGVLERIHNLRAGMEASEVPSGKVPRRRAAKNTAGASSRKQVPEAAAEGSKNWKPIAW